MQVDHAIHYVRNWGLNCQVNMIVIIVYMYFISRGKLMCVLSQYQCHVIGKGKTAINNQ